MSVLVVEALVTPGEDLSLVWQHYFVSGARFEEWECYKLSDCDFDKQCQGTPGRCIDPCTNDVDTGQYSGVLLSDI